MTTNNFILNKDLVVVIFGGELYFAGKLHRIKLTQVTEDCTLISTLLVKLEGLSDIIDITSNGTSSYALTSEGRVISLNVLDAEGKYLIFPPFENLPIKLLSNQESIVLISERSVTLVNSKQSPIRQMELHDGSYRDLLLYNSLLIILEDSGRVVIKSLKNKSLTGSISNGILDTFRMVESINVNNDLLTITSHDGSVAAYRLLENQDAVIRTEVLSSTINCNDLLHHPWGSVNFVIKLRDGLLVNNKDELYSNIAGVNSLVTKDFDDQCSIAVRDNDVMFNDKFGKIYYYTNRRLSLVRPGYNFGKKLMMITKTVTTLI
jgi:hypothetical protein